MVQVAKMQEKIDLSRTQSSRLREMGTIGCTALGEKSSSLSCNIARKEPICNACHCAIIGTVRSPSMSGSRVRQSGRQGRSSRGHRQRGAWWPTSSGTGIGFFYFLALFTRDSAFIYSLLQLKPCRNFIAGLANRAIRSPRAAGKDSWRDSCSIVLQFRSKLPS